MPRPGAPTILFTSPGGGLMPRPGAPIIIYNILTVWCQSQSSEQCRLACFDIGGSQVVSIDIELNATVAKLKEAIVALTAHKGHWRLITPNSKLLDNPKIMIADMLYL